jgi:hypothetical protein
MGWYLTAQCIWYIVMVVRRDGNGLADTLGGVGPGVSLALACYGIVGAFYPFALVSYHFYLTITGQNTHEYVCCEPNFTNCSCVISLFCLWNEVNHTTEATD